MNKFSQGLVLAAIVLMSTQSFAAITVRILNCGVPRTGDGRMIVGTGYKVQIRGGFDTHAVNPNGTIGAPIAPSFQLISKVVSPGATARVQDLTLVSRDNGNYILTGDGVNVTVNDKMNQAVVNFSNNNSTASCD